MSSLLLRAIGSSLVSLALVSFGLLTYHLSFLDPVFALAPTGSVNLEVERVVEIVTPLGILAIGVFLLVVS